MNSNFPPNTDPNLFTITAAIVGALSAGDFNSYELYSIGNWIILVGQYLVTYAAQTQLIESRIQNHNININSRQCKSGGSPFINNGPSNQTHRTEIDYLMAAINKIQKELDKIKKEMR